MSQYRTGLLVFSELDSLSDHMGSIQQLIDNVILAEQLGFSRVWLGGHYLRSRAQSWSNPEMLIPLLASATEKIRIGIAGTLITIHQPFDIATNFKLLANLFPGRIDLGVAKGGGREFGVKDPEVVYANKVRQLADYLHEERAHYDGGLVMPPLLGEIPELWLLGSSYRALGFALEARANFSRSLFHLGRDPNPDCVQLGGFVADYLVKHGRAPMVNLAVAVCCCETTAAAKRIVESKINSGAVGLDPGGIVFGTPSELNDRLSALKECYGVDEFILLQLYEEQEDRVRGLELMAGAFGL